MTRRRSAASKRRAGAREWLRRQIGVLRFRRLGRPSWTRYRGRGAPPGWRIAKTTLAAVVAFQLALLLPSTDVPLLAPLTALLVTQVTVFGSVKSGVQRVGSVVAGVLLAVALSKVMGLTWWSLAILIFVSLVIGQVLHLGEQQLEVPISAMLVLAVSGQAQAAQSRILETLVGAATGVAVNLALGPPVYAQPAGDAIGALADDMAELLSVMGEELTDGWSSEQARSWLHRERELDRPLREAGSAVARAEESLRLNPLRRRAIEGTVSLRAALAALEHAELRVRGICRDLADLADGLEARNHDEPEVLVALGRLLIELSECVTAFGRLVAPDVTGPPREAMPLQMTLDIARTNRDVLAELMLVGVQEDPELWQIQGSLLSDVDSLLVEMDVERGGDARRVRRR